MRGDGAGDALGEGKDSVALPTALLAQAPDWFLRRDAPIVHAAVVREVDTTFALWCGKQKERVEPK